MKSFVKDLIEIGLTELEARVYLNLLRKQNFTATELATAVKVHRTQIYDILANLVKKGMCVEIFGNVKKYEAVEPRKVMNLINEKLDSQKKISDRLAETLSQLFKSNSGNSNPLDFIKVLRTNSSIREQVFRLISESNTSVLVFNKPPYAMTPDRNDPESNSLRKGVIHKSIYQIEPDTEAFIEKVKYFQQEGEDVRINPKLPVKLVIFDQRITLMTLYNAGEIGSFFTAMSVEHTDFAQAMSDIFELYWNNSMTLAEFIDQKKKS